MYRIAIVAIPLYTSSYSYTDRVEAMTPFLALTVSGTLLGVAKDRKGVCLFQSATSISKQILAGKSSNETRQHIQKAIIFTLLLKNPPEKDTKNI